MSKAKMYSYLGIVILVISLVIALLVDRMMIFISVIPVYGTLFFYAHKENVNDQRSG